MRAWGLMGLIVLALMCPAAPGQPLTTPASRPNDIPRLIQNLNSATPAIRQKAVADLMQLGDAALPALEQAAAQADAAGRAHLQAVIRRLNELSRREAVVLRAQGRAAFYQGDYPTMAARYARLARMPEASLDDRLWAGHAWQLQENWPRAVAAYQAALTWLEQQPVEQPGKPPAPRRLDGRRPMNARQFSALRTGLLLLISHLQDDQLHDPKAATATITHLLDLVPGASEPLDQAQAAYAAKVKQALTTGHWPEPKRDYAALYALSQGLDRLAHLKEEQHDVAGALAAVARLRLVRLSRGYDSAYPELLSVARLMGQWPADRPRPAIPGVVAMGEAPLHLDLTDPAVWAQAWQGYRLASGLFLLCPPPGREFATLKLSADVELLDPRYGLAAELLALYPGRRTLDPIGRLEWPPGQERRGRTTCRGQWPVPPGASLVGLRIFQRAQAIKVSSASLSATFRPADLQASPPPQPIWLQNEVLPPSGTLSVDGHPASNNIAINGFPPGRHRFVYTTMDGDARAETTLEAQPGRRYGVFLNVDSPFTSSFTNLPPIDYPLSGASLACLADGRYLLAFVQAGRDVMLATSRDLVHWDPPQPLPLNLGFHNTEPSLLVDKLGTIWLAWFSNRLSLYPDSGGGYQLWLAHSRDGKTWSAPRPIEGDYRSGWPLTPVRLLRTTDGRYWLFWRNFAVSGASPQAWSKLEPLPWVTPPATSPADPFVTCSPDGVLHMIYDAPGSDIFYTHTDPQGRWVAPAPIIKAPAANPQLVILGHQAVLIYTTSDGAYLTQGALPDLSQLSPPVKITNQVVPLRTPLVAIPGNAYAALAGGDTVWLLTSPRDLLVMP